MKLSTSKLVRLEILNFLRFVFDRRVKSHAILIRRAKI
jgi:hypothetical protein